MTLKRAATDDCEKTPCQTFQEVFWRGEGGAGNGRAPSLTWLLHYKKIYIAVTNRPTLVFKRCTLSREDPFLEVVLKFHIYSHEACTHQSVLCFHVKFSVENQLKNFTPSCPKKKKKSHFHMLTSCTQKSPFFFAKWSKLALKKVNGFCAFHQSFQPWQVCAALQLWVHSKLFPCAFHQISCKSTEMCFNGSRFQDAQGWNKHWWMGGLCVI